MKFCKIVIVGEAPLSANLSGTGQTIYNLFLNYPEEKVFSYVPEVKKELFGTKDVEEFLKGAFRNLVGTYNTEKLAPLRNRLGIYLNPLISLFNLQWQQWFPSEVPKEIKQFAPDLVLICPNEEEGMLKGYQLAKQLRIPFVIFLMDDWMHLSKKKWAGNNVHSLTYKVLSESAGWVMISKQLRDLLVDRYKVTPSLFCVAHNPVTSENKHYVAPVEKQKKRIVYAGSIWPMHYDSLLAVAQGAALLRQEGVNIEIVIYSFEHFWEQYKDVFTPLGVVFGGRVAYADLHPFLQEGDLLLVTSTFGEQYKSHTLSSLQTKVTDYMIAGRAILACGPVYSACNLFVKQWECGVVCETLEPEQVKQLLKETLAQTEKMILFGKRGYDAASQYFNREVLSQGLYEMLTQSVTK